jgi:putative tricarboxylic transport membrane protein
MLIHGISPGPLVMTKNPELFWGLIASMWIGNVMLVILNLPLIGMWVSLLRLPYSVLFPAIIVFCCIGVYSVNNSPFEVYLVAVAGLIGYVLIKLKCEPAPLIIGFILGPMIETYLRRTLIISDGDPTVFLTRPLSAIFLLIAAAALVVICLPALSKKRTEVFAEGD